MPDDIYSAADVLEKTLFADKDLSVYDGYVDRNYQPKKIGIVKKGNPAGIVYSWISADPARGRDTLWWMFYPATASSNYYFIPHHPGDFDVSALREQGVITEEEKAEAEKDANKEWYERLAETALKAIVPVALIIGLGGPAIRGFLSRKSNNK